MNIDSANPETFFATTIGPLALRLSTSREAMRLYSAAGDMLTVVGVEQIRDTFAAAGERKLWSEDAALLEREQRVLLERLGRPRIFCGMTVDRTLAAEKKKAPPAPGRALAVLLAGYLGSTPKSHRVAAMNVEAEDFIMRAAAWRGYRVNENALAVERSKHRRTIDVFARTHVEIRSLWAGAKNSASINWQRDSAKASWLNERGVLFDRSTDAKWAEPSRCDSSAVSRDHKGDWQLYELAYQALHRLLPLDSLRREVKPDGRIHPLIRTNIAITGRMSISSPAIQNLPSKRQGTRHVIQPDDGFDFVSVDHSNAELRVLARYIDTPSFTARVMDGDIYADVAEASGRPRTETKWMTIAYMYNLGIKKLSLEVGVDVANAVFGAIKEVAPEIPAFLTNVTQRAASGEQFETLFGRPLPSLDGASSDARFGLQANLLISGSARDAFGIAIRRAAAAGLTPAIPLHDELFVLSPAGRSAETIATLMECMTVDLGSGVHLSGKHRVSHGRWT